MEEETPRVAVIDDERRIRTLLEIGLADEGFAVRTASDSALGLALVREWKPDVIVLDVMMPKIDGIALLPLVRRLTETPVVMLSSTASIAVRSPTGSRDPGSDWRSSSARSNVRTGGCAWRALLALARHSRYSCRA